MKSIAKIISVVLAVAIPFMASAADKSSAILKSSAEKFRTSPSIQCTYSLKAANSTSGGQATFAGDRFKMSTPEMSVWYDGRTQWSLLTAQNEVTVTEPTDQELSQVNPFVIINNFSKNFTSKFIASAAKGTKRILLTPRKGSTQAIKSATITISDATQLPTEIVVVDSDGHTFTITITSLKIGKALPESNFRFPKNSYPKTEIIDLR